MDSRKLVFQETGWIALGEVVLSAIMVGIFALAGYFAMNVVWGALVGAGIIVGNHFLMAVTVSVAADRAKAGEPKRAKAMIQLSGTLRLLAMGGILVVAIKAGCNVLATVLPLAFIRLILLLMEFFRKKGDGWTESK